MSLNLSIGSTYTFNTLAPAILGAVIKNAVLEMSCSFAAAMKFENVKLKYQQCLPALPDGTPTDPSGVVWYRFQSESGEFIFLAEPMIDAVSLDVQTNLNFTVSVINATLQQKQNVRVALAHLGVDFTINDN